MRHDAPPSDADLERLAAGELAEPAAAALRRLVERDATLGARLERAGRVVRALASVPLERAPADLAARVLLAIDRPREAAVPGRWRAVLRLAAAAACFALAVLAFSEAAPAMAQELAPGVGSVRDAVAPVLALPTRVDASVVVAGDGPVATALAAVGGVLLVLGPLLASRWRRTAAARGSP